MLRGITEGRQVTIDDITSGFENIGPRLSPPLFISCSLSLDQRYHSLDFLVFDCPIRSHLFGIKYVRTVLSGTVRNNTERRPMGGKGDVGGGGRRHGDHVIQRATDPNAMLIATIMGNSLTL